MSDDRALIEPISFSSQDRQAVNAHLDEVVQSPPFLRSPRCCEFLRFVVDHALDGQLDQLKERSIGLALFGRKADYETAEDSIVRVRANEVRKRLVQHYAQAPATRVLFELPVGSYVPHIKILETNPTVEPAPESVRSPKRWLWVPAALGVAAIAGAVLWVAIPGPTPVEAFWRPVLNSAQPALLWSSAGEFQRLPPKNLRELLQADGGVANLRIDSREVQHVESQISSGNLHSVVSICSLLQRLGRAPRYRVGGEISLTEMGSHPLVLIGAFSNPWVMQLNSGWRYQFVQGRLAIKDSQTPGREWMLPATEPRTGFDATVDYALVTRVFRPDTRQVLIAVGGLKHFGTGAAGEFVTNPLYWREATALLPKDWSRRNIQVVLETRVIRKAAGPPKVLAVHCW